MTCYYGFMVCILTGDIDELEGEFKYKPEHKDAGFSAYAKWYESKVERNTMVEYTMNEIQNCRGNDG